MRIAIAAALALTALAANAGAEPLTLRIGWAQAPTQLTTVIDELMRRHKDMFAHVGQTYALAPIRFQGSTPQIQGLASGELDIGEFAPPALAIAVANAKLDLRIIADVMQDGIPGHFGTYWVVRKDGPIHAIEDMRHHRAAVNARGTGIDMLLHEAMRGHGLADGDYTIIEADFANMLPLIENDKVDTVPVMPQFGHDFEATGRYRTLFDLPSVAGPSQVGFWVMRPDFIAAHRPAIVDFLEDDMRAVRWITDPANHEEALAIAMAVTKQSHDALAYAFGPTDLYHSPDLKPDIPAVQKDIDQAFDMKLLPERVVVAPHYVDLSLVAEAKARLDGK
jgi:sulfonate transport system substrate-binding protein